MRAKNQSKGEHVGKAENSVTLWDKVHRHNDHTGDTKETKEIE
jgi:hypothetical protein